MTVYFDPVKRPKREELAAVYDAATAENDWERLKPYPMLLTTWQAHHDKDLLPISLWVSHFRLDKHTRCRPDCTDLDYWLPLPSPPEQQTMDLAEGVDIPSTFPI